MYLEATDEAHKFYKYYLSSDGMFKTLLQHYMKKDKWKEFLKELDRILTLFESKFKHLQGDDSIAYKYDFIDFLESSKSIASKNKYTKKIDDVVKEVNQIEPYIVLKCEDILVCSLSIGDTYSSYMPDFHFKKDGDNWYETRKDSIQKSGSLLKDDKTIILKTLDKLNNIRETFLGVTKYCFKAHEHQDPKVLFNPNVEILGNLDSLQDIVSEIYNTSFDKPPTYLENIKTYILAILKDFYENLKHKYALDLQRIHYHKELEKFKNEIKNLEFSKLKSPTLFDNLPLTLQLDQKFSSKEKLIIHLLFTKFGDTNYGLQRVWRFLKEYGSEYDFSFKMTLIEFNAFIEKHYTLDYATSSTQRNHKYAQYKKEMKSYLDNREYDM